MPGGGGGGGEFEPPESSILKEIHMFYLLMWRCLKGPEFTSASEWLLLQGLGLNLLDRLISFLSAKRQKRGPSWSRTCLQFLQNCVKKCQRSQQSLYTSSVCAACALSEIKLCFLPATSVATRMGISCFLNELMTLSLSN